MGAKQGSYPRDHTEMGNSTLSGALCVQAELEAASLLPWKEAEALGTDTLSFPWKFFLFYFFFVCFPSGHAIASGGTGTRKGNPDSSLLAQ